MKCLIAIVSLFSVSNIYAQGNGRNVLLQMANAMQAKRSISYDIFFTKKSSDTTSDTSRLAAHVEMQRVITDTLMGGMVWIAPTGNAGGLKYYRGTYMFYDLKNAYKVFIRTKNIMYQNPYVTKPARMFEAMPEAMVWKPFLKIGEIRKLAGNKYNITVLRDTVIGKNNCYSIMIKPVKTSTEWYWIWRVNKQDYMLVNWEQWVLYDDKSVQYEHFSIKSYQFDNLKDERFSAKQLPVDCKLNEIKR